MRTSLLVRLVPATDQVQRRRNTLLFDQVVARLSGPVIKTHVALAIGIAGDVTDLERIVLGRYERTELLPIRLGQIKTTPPSAPAPSRKCA